MTLRGGSRSAALPEITKEMASRSSPATQTTGQNDFLVISLLCPLRKRVRPGTGKRIGPRILVISGFPTFGNVARHGQDA